LKSVCLIIQKTSLWSSPHFIFPLLSIAELINLSATDVKTTKVSIILIILDFMLNLKN
jgi:hypothetical protein